MLMLRDTNIALDQVNFFLGHTAQSSLASVNVVAEYLKTKMHKTFTMPGMSFAPGM